MAMLAETRRKKFYALCPKGKPLFEDENRFGSKMLMKMGWSKGKGLGVNEDGTQEFIRIRYKNDVDGLGYDQRDDQWTQHEEHFNNILKSLHGSENNSDDNDNGNCNSKGNEDDLVTKGFGFTETSEAKSKKIKLKEKISGESLEEKSMKSRARVHYKKFTKGKDLTQYSEKDLANIFGKKSIEDKEKLTQQSSLDDIYKQFTSFISEEKKDENQQNNNVENTSHFGGVTTIKQSLSIDDYFKQKMNSLKNKKNHIVNVSDKEKVEPLSANDLQESISLIKKKKSKKRSSPKEEEEREEETANLNLNLGGTLVINSKKSKKKKLGDIENPLEMLTPFAAEEQHSTVDKPKKKKKRKAYDDDMEEVAAEQVSTVDIPKKKKKKKTHDDDMEDVVLLDFPNKKTEAEDIVNNLKEFSYEGDMSVVSDLPKKKKKSKKSLEGKKKNENEVSTEIESMQSSKKKKNKKFKINKEEMVDCEDTKKLNTDLKSEETKSKKSKKAKNFASLLTLQDDADQESENLKENKRKKSKIPENCLNASLVSNKEALESELSDSKKKKNKSEDSVTSFSINALELEKTLQTEIEDLKEPKRKKNKKLQTEAPLPIESISSAESLELTDNEAQRMKSKADKNSLKSNINDLKGNSSEENKANNEEIMNTNENENDFVESIQKSTNEMIKPLSSQNDCSKYKNDEDDTDPEDVNPSTDKFRHPKNLKDCEKLLNSYNVFKISQFTADKFALFQLDSFKGSNLSEISGYSFDENLELKIVQNTKEDQYYEKLVRYEEKKKFHEKKLKQFQKYKNHLKEKYIEKQNQLKKKGLKAKEEIINDKNCSADHLLHHGNPNDLLMKENKQSNCEIDKDPPNELSNESNLPSSSVTNKELEKATGDTKSGPFGKQKSLKNKFLKKKMFMDLQRKKFYDKRKRRNAFSGI